MLAGSCLYGQTADDLFSTVSHHYAENNGVKIHYVKKGKGPMILFVHGFPDFWYTWRDQMNELHNNYTVAAMDLRGYNRSDRPEGKENYTFDILVGDVVAVIEHSGVDKVHLVAHDWGAAIAWRVAAQYPQLVEKLVILSISHPKAGDPKTPVPKEERKPTYADRFVSEEFSQQLTANWFSGWVKDVEAKPFYREAFGRSDKEAMINYYRANFPTLENLDDPEFLNRNREMANLTMPVLVIHGKKDRFASTRAHNNTWDFVDNELTIKVLPEAGHFVQQDASEAVTRLIRDFIKTR